MLYTFDLQGILPKKHFCNSDLAIYQFWSRCIDLLIQVIANVWIRPGSSYLEDRGLNNSVFTQSVKF